jgi:adenosine kinase
MLDITINKDNDHNHNDISSLEHVLLGIENPLLDMVMYCDKAYLDHYQLRENDGILASEQHLPIYEELAMNPCTQYIAGGSAQNTIRTVQWMLRGSYPEALHATVYIGCVGKDGYSERLRSEASKDGVTLQYMEDPSTPTGTCAVLIYQNHRALVANLGAANNYKSAHLQQPDVWCYVEKARFYYSTGFFLTVSPESLAMITHHATSNGKIVAFNLAAPYIAKLFGNRLLDVLPYCDYLFGNSEEAIAFAEANNLEFSNITDIGVYLAMYSKVYPNRGRTVVLTQSAQPTLVITADGMVQMYPVIPIKPEEIMDTNGAGDAFVGGFLSQLILGRNLQRCVAAGHFAAHVIIQQSGIQFPIDKYFI